MFISTFVIHSVTSNFYLFTCCYGVSLHKMRCYQLVLLTMINLARAIHLGFSTCCTVTRSTRVWCHSQLRLPTWEVNGTQHEIGLSMATLTRMQANDHRQPRRYVTDRSVCWIVVRLRGQPRTRLCYWLRLRLFANLLCHWQPKFYSPLCLHGMEVNRRWIFATAASAYVWYP